MNSGAGDQPRRRIRQDLLGGLRVQISGAIPEEKFWPKSQPNLNERILDFVQRLSELVVLYGGRLVHGNQPGLTPAIVGCVQRTLGAAVARQRKEPALTLIASALWPLSWNFSLDPELISVIETPAVGTGNAEDPETRNKSLTALRLTQSQESDVVVAIGGRLHSDSGYNPGVLEDLCVARWRNLPCFLIASFGGLTGGLAKEIIHQFSANNMLDDRHPSGKKKPAETTRMASWEGDIPSIAGDLLAHLVAHRKVFADPKGKADSWIRTRIPIGKKAISSTQIAIRKANVPQKLVDQAADRFKRVLQEIKATPPDIPKLARLLGHGSP